MMLGLAVVVFATALPPHEVSRHRLPFDQVPPPAQERLREENGGRVPRNVAQVLNSDGKVDYEATVRKPFTNRYDVAVAGNGDLVGKWRHESGTGP